MSIKKYVNMKITKDKIIKSKINIDFPSIDKVIFLLSFFPLIAAYIAEYGFGLEPCKLCIYQRIPFFIIIFFALFPVFFFKNIKLKNYIFYLALLLLFSNMMLALYHVGIEQKIFELPASCSGADILNMPNIDQLTELIMNKSAAKCDEPEFEFFGITMAVMNVLYCLFAITLICLIKGELFKFK
ncbi:disulfide bond formation protein B [Rickettsiales bacterium]|nr:disulfide bond formation protein B [Rickettsiales bacterium]